MDTFMEVLYLILGIAALKIVLLLIIAKGNFGLIKIATAKFFEILLKGESSHEIIIENKTSPKLNTPSSIWPLFLLQREGRLIDFLMEDISGASDEQIGAGVREVHGNCRKYLLEKLSVKPILGEQEGDNYSVQTGFDSSKIMLIGNIEGNPPYQGIVRHHGWTVEQSNFPEVPDSFMKQPVLAQAEIEIPGK